MNFKHSKLRSAVRLALCLGVSGMVVSTFAAAQDSDPARLDQITVTGTRLASPGIVANSPITTITAEELEVKQVVAIEDFLREMPALVPAIGPGTNNGSGGGATIDLRGLGTNRTLVLVNGRRVIPFNLAGVVDTNFIPVAMIESVEIVTGGASAVYGADAVAGVINFILKKDFEGAEFSAQWGQSADSDGDRQRVDATIGGNFAEGRGNAVLSVGHTKTDPVLQGSRSFGERSLSSVSGNPQGSGTSVPANVFNNSGAARAGGGICPDGSLGCPTSFNFNPLNLFQTPLDRLQASALARFALTDDHEAYGEFMYARSDVFTQLAPSGTFFNDYFVPVGNPYIPNAARQQICADMGIAAAACVVGNPQEALLTIGRRLVELGPRLNNFENKLSQGTVGFKGYLTDTWQYDTYYSFGEADQVQTRGNWGSNSRIQQALRAVSTTACQNTANGCVPINVFGPAGSVTQEMINFFNLDALLLQSVEQDVFGASVQGDLGEGFKSPWAAYPIAVSAGFEQRDTSASTKSDAATQINGEVLGTGAATPDRRGSFSLQELFVESIIPIINDAPGAYSLSFEGGYRRSTFETAGKSTSYNTYKYGGEYAPIESFRVRALQQRATRAPNINELFNPLVTGLDNLAVDPCAGLNPTASRELCLLTGVPANLFGSVQQPSAGQVNILQGGNPLLGPEVADTLTVGFVWTPAFADALSVTLDYYDIDIDKLVSAPTVDDILTGCYQNNNRATCALIGRNPNNGTFNGTNARGIGLALSNLGKLRTNGFDLGINYGLGLGDMGGLDFSLNLNKLRTYDFQATPTSIVRDCVGLYSISCGVIHDFKSVFRTTWNYNDFGVSLNWRHLGGVTEEPGGQAFLPAFASIGSHNYFDLGASWKYNDMLRVNLSVANVADKQPPVVGNTIAATAINSGNTFPQFYDTIGRFYTMGVTVSF